MVKNTIENIHTSDSTTVPWTLRQTIITMCCTLLPYCIFTWTALFLNTGKSSQPQKVLNPTVDLFNALTVFVLSLLIYGIVFVAAPIYVARRTVPVQPGVKRRHALLDALGFRSFDWRRATTFIFLFFLAIFLLNFLYQALIQYFHLPLQTNDQRILDEGKHTPITLYATLIIAVLVAPICEEIFFRSFVFMGLLRGLSLSIALSLSALIFALSHNDLGSFAVLFFIGLFLAILRWSSRSIWPGIILHVLNNAAGALTILLALHTLS